MVELIKGEWSGGTIRKGRLMRLLDGYMKEQFLLLGRGRCFFLIGA